MQEVHPLLRVTRRVRHMRECLRGHTERPAPLAGIQADIDLILVKICACCEERLAAENAVRVKILSVGSLLKA